MSGLGLGHGTHVPLPLPVADDVGSVVIDRLTLSDLAQQAAPGRIVDLDIKNGWISSQNNSFLLVLYSKVFYLHPESESEIQCHWEEHILRIISQVLFRLKAVK